ncbi:MAG: hypothetical protein IPL35_00270 [Sphingobacteriales bacterium]|nr:hypothetical protein [Sphingobacteriales bacterium]
MTQRLQFLLMLVSFCFLLFFPDDTRAQQTYEFEILRMPQENYLQSCLSVDMYRENFLLPIEGSEGRIKKPDYKDSMPHRLVAVKGAKWINEECILFPVADLSDTEIKEMLFQIMNLKEKDIIILNKK